MLRILLHLNNVKH